MFPVNPISFVKPNFKLSLFIIGVSVCIPIKDQVPELMKADMSWCVFGIAATAEAVSWVAVKAILVWVKFRPVLDCLLIFPRTLPGLDIGGNIEAGISNFSKMSNAHLLNFSLHY